MSSVCFASSWFLLMKFLISASVFPSVVLCSAWDVLPLGYHEDTLHAQAAQHRLSRPPRPRAVPLWRGLCHKDTAVWVTRPSLWGSVQGLIVSTVSQQPHCCSFPHLNLQSSQDVFLWANSFHICKAYKYRLYLSFRGSVSMPTAHRFSYCSFKIFIPTEDVKTWSHFLFFMLCFQFSGLFSIYTEWKWPHQLSQNNSRIAW